MKILVVGGGFGGVKASLELLKDKRNHVTLISDRPDFQYYPALYGTATGRSHLQSWVPLGQIFAGKDNLDVVIDSVVAVDRQARYVSTATGERHSYDIVIFALGAVTTFFGIDGLDKFAYGIKSAGEIQKLKQHLYNDMASGTPEDNYVVIGGGPTGVELAAALGSYVNRLHKRFKIKNRKYTIHMVEAAPRILPRMSEKASAIVTRRLKKLGIKIKTSKGVERENADGLIIAGEPLKSHTVIWTSGVANHPFFKENGFTVAKNGKVEVNEFLAVDDHTYILGDNAATPFSGLAQTALRDAVFVARNISRRNNKRRQKKYKAIMPPVVVPVGEDWAIFSWKKVLISGWPASVIRKVADFVGYSDMLPFGQALGVWRAERIMEDDYFPAIKK